MHTLRRISLVMVLNFLMPLGNFAFAQSGFTPYPDNPVLTYGEPGSWDAGVVFLPNVIYKDGLFYMFYTGSEDLSSVPISIGYATSEDGYTWTKYSGNPVFEADGTGFDANAVANATIVLEDSLWVMYYNGRPSPGPGPGPFIGRATAKDPAGPWKRLDEPVLTHGNPGEWDYFLASPGRVFATDSGYVMYYTGGGNFMANEPFMTGMAFSPDGIVWTKYNDPATTDSLFATSDPVLRVGAPGSYDGGTAAFSDVVRTDSGWDMFYAGSPGVFSGPGRICYATSNDGIHWMKDPKNPLLEPTQDWASALVAPSAIIVNDTYFLYYLGRTTPFDGQIGLATAPKYPQRPADKFLRKVYHFGQDSIQYRLFVPKDSISSNTYPLILTFNGNGTIGNDNNSHIISYRIAETWAEDSAQQKNPAFVFSPQVPPPPGDLRTYLRNTFLPAVDEILDSLIIEFPVDTSRLYITGLSLGSLMTWGYIYRQNLNRFAAAIPISGGANQVLNEFQITSIPIWAFHGDNDNTIPVQSTRDMMSAIENAGYKVRYIHSQLGDIGLADKTLDSLLAAGVNHIYTEYEGAGHDIFNPTYDNLILHRWLFSQKKEFDPLNVKSQPISANPTLYRLYANYPNPFNPQTRIKFELSKPGQITIKVFDLLGKEVQILLDQFRKAGSYSVVWDVKNDRGRQVSSGIYLYQMQINGTVVQARKMVLLR